MNKRCSKCKTNKPVTDFNKNRSGKDGLDHQCRDCKKAFRESRKAEAAEYKRQWDAKNKAPSPDREGIWKSGDNVGYIGAHNRVKSRYGSAFNYPCVDCGETAKDWTYNHQDPNEKLSTTQKSVLRYSPNPDYYEARCLTCHRTHDRNATV